jgi:hypothetical protein
MCLADYWVSAALRLGELPRTFAVLRRADHVGVGEGHDLRPTFRSTGVEKDCDVLGAGRFRRTSAPGLHPRETHRPRRRHGGRPDRHGEPRRALGDHAVFSGGDDRTGLGLREETTQLVGLEDGVEWGRD